MVLESNKTSLILEDDVVFSENFIEEAKKHKKDLKNKSFDFYYYYRVKRIRVLNNKEVDENPIDISKYFHKPKTSYSAAAYVLSPSGKKI
jgi:GR25 family glycosyltransferase involved in LPS biosynthesis